MAVLSRSACLLLTLGLLCLPGLTACDGQNTNSASEETNSESTSESNGENKKKVLTSFTVLADMARNVAGDKLEVESITRVGAEVHGYEPTPSDLKKAQDADLILFNGLNLERWLEPFLGNVKDTPSVVLTEGITPIPIASGAYANNPNPHAWMSPKLAQQYVENIRQAFVELDPNNAATYNANAEAYKKQLMAIANQLETALAQVPENQRVLVTCEGAFSYLAKDYGLKEVYLWPINADQQSTPQQVKTVIDKVNAQQVPAVFCESTVNSKGQETVAQSTGAIFGGNLYVDSLSAPDGPVPTYLDLLTYDITAIAEGLKPRSP